MHKYDGFVQSGLHAAQQIISDNTRTGHLIFIKLFFIFSSVDEHCDIIAVSALILSKLVVYTYGEE